MKNIILLILLLYSQWGIAQKYKSSNGSIKFYSEELLEDITAINNEVKSIFDAETGNLVFSVAISAFEFDKSLMKEHFNEKYLESNKYPKATFQGNVTGFKIDQKNPLVWAKGVLDIHGQKQKITQNGSLDFAKDKVVIHSFFVLKLVDYDITIPSLMFQNIAEEIEVTVDIEYKTYDN